MDQTLTVQQTKDSALKYWKFSKCVEELKVHMHYPVVSVYSCLKILYF